MTAKIEELRAQLVNGLNVPPEWRDAFEAVPRHVFVPRIIGCWPPDDEGRREGFVLDDTDSDRWLELVYSDRLLIIADDGERLSSSSSPTAMLRFLRLLEIQDANTVLEIGTGSGYNAAVLCERLGSQRVASIDIDPELVELARQRLKRCGYAPRLAVANGWLGYPPSAPYDRLVATCSVPRIPETWTDQLRVGGVLVTPLRGGRFDASGLVALRKAADGALTGRLDNDGASFMAMRNGGPPGPPSVARPDLIALARMMEGQPRPCTVPPYMVDPNEPSVSPHFLLRLNELEPWEWCWFDGPDGEPKGPAVAASDGSWARVIMRDPAVVFQGGPRRLWDMVESNWELFMRLGKPGMGRYGMTVTPERRQYIWLDVPDSGRIWEL